MERKLIHMSKKQIEFIRNLSEEFGVSFSEMVRRIIDDYIKRSRKEE